jgi:hypothetical protein
LDEVNAWARPLSFSLTEEKELRPRFSGVVERAMSAGFIFGESFSRRAWSLPLEVAPIVCIKKFERRKFA